jgi:hypothetical protein
MAVLILRFYRSMAGWTNPARVNDAFQMSLAKVIGGGLPASALLWRGEPRRRYVRVKEADRVNPTAFVTGWGGEKRNSESGKRKRAPDRPLL